MEGWWRRGKWVVLLMALHSVGILIFTRGFLLTRTELPYHSSCSDISQSPCSSSQSKANKTQSDPQCWTKPVVDRLVIIVLDALRYSLFCFTCLSFCCLISDTYTCFSSFLCFSFSRFDFVAPSNFFKG